MASKSSPLLILIRLVHFLGGLMSGRADCAATDRPTPSAPPAAQSTSHEPTPGTATLALTPETATVVPQPQTRNDCSGKTPLFSFWGFCNLHRNHRISHAEVNQGTDQYSPTTSW